MIISVSVRSHKFGISVGRSIEIGEPFTTAFDPVDFCDSNYMACVVGGVEAKSHKANIIAKFREEVAKELADEIASNILEQMKSLDIVNGYKVSK